ncbi:PAS domain-containing protein [Ferrovibrio terrae]|uniref:PAS domain-containing protein n=1 Tax=Ferrovibrio terrae TaxID=2594003 RepID=A0A516H4S3_9PROT|nr:PAS domain-containing protein [Ferrovibrio terrae]QDO98741.1 PAS domain-containing protein [Ferrovibrio terrae]
MQRPDYAKLDAQFARMRDYLAGVAPPGKLPGRQHIDPLAIRALLSFTNLVDVERTDGKIRFRFRLIGTLQSTAAGREISGQYLEDAVLPEYFGRIHGNMMAVLERREAVYDRFGMPHPGRDFIDTERVYFPLARDGENVDMLLILNAYPDEEKTAAPAVEGKASRPAVRHPAPPK